jgi:hypothetical protein
MNPLVSTSSQQSIPELDRMASLRTNPSESERLGALFSPQHTLEQFKSAFGTGLRGSLMMLAHHITWQTDCFVYGGFLRDYIVGAMHHGEMDLDISLPKKGLDPQTALSQVMHIY